MSIPHYWVKWEIHHKECGVLGNVIHVFFSASGYVRFSLYCFACATTFDVDTSLEDIIVECNDKDRLKRAKEMIEERKEFDLKDWDPEGEEEN